MMLLTKAADRFKEIFIYDRRKNKQFKLNG
jgi:hypothetical protein